MYEKVNFIFESNPINIFKEGCMRGCLVKCFFVLLFIMPLGTEAITTAPVIAWVGGSYQGKTPDEVMSQYDAIYNNIFQRCMDNRPENGVAWSCAQISYSMSGSEGPIINGLPARVFYSCTKYEFGVGWDGQSISVSSTCTTMSVVKQVRCMSGGYGVKRQSIPLSATRK